MTTLLRKAEHGYNVELIDDSGRRSIVAQIHDVMICEEHGVAKGFALTIFGAIEAERAIRELRQRDFNGSL